ncbi:MAG: M23 family metallopeptidase [Nanoarchaeota archaeon]
MKNNVIIGVGIAIVVVVLVFGIFFGKEFISKNIFKRPGENLNSLYKKSLGNLCSGEEECREFCLGNKGVCEDYCQGIENELCGLLNKNSGQDFNDGKSVPELNRDETNTDDRPVLKNFGFNIEPWDKNTNRAGDLIFSKDIVFEDPNILSEWVFVEFGGQGQRKSDPASRNIEYWFYVPLTTDIIAPIDGTITDVGFFDHTKDFGINFQLKENSKWIVSFEHVIDVKVKRGDVVKAGDIVAKAAPRINDKIAMTELAVWTGGSDGIYKYCPFDFLDEELKSVYEEKLNRLVRDWEEFIGRDVYDQEAWVSPGCLVDSIKER